MTESKSPSVSAPPTEAELQKWLDEIERPDLGPHCQCAARLRQCILALRQRAKAEQVGPGSLTDAPHLEGVDPLEC